MSEAGKRLIAEAQRAREKVGAWKREDGQCLCCNGTGTDYGETCPACGGTGYDPNHGLCEECHEAPAIGLTRDGRYLCEECLFQEETR